MKKQNSFARMILRRVFTYIILGPILGEIAAIAADATDVADIGD